MHEIVCVGDVHEGLSFDFRIDPETGISERALDLHGNFAKAARWAIEHDASLFCILGDLFDRDRKSTRLNSSHLVISYAVFCLKKKNIAVNGMKMRIQKPDP